jgi:hypothetical protein
MTSGLQETKTLYYSSMAKPGPRTACILVHSAQRQNLISNKDGLDVVVLLKPEFFHVHY